MTFEFNPFVGTGPYKLHSFDPDRLLDHLGEARRTGTRARPASSSASRSPSTSSSRHFANEGAKILAQLTHQLDAVDLSAEGLKAALAQGKTTRAYQPTYPWVVNNDPAFTGITFNTAKAPV